MTNPNYRPGVTVELSAGGNLIIESRYQNAGNARVVVERGDIADLIAALQRLGIFLLHADGTKTKLTGYPQTVTGLTVKVTKE